MQFQSDLAKKAMSGDKTVTRRVVRENPRSPWYVERCGKEVDRTYAVCPGRSEGAIGRVRIVSVTQTPLGRLDDEEARREGFGSAAEFEEVWRRIHRGYDESVRVWRVEFEAVGAG